MGQSPRVPSVVSRTHEPKPMGRMNTYFLSFVLNPRTDSPSTHSCSASVELRASFWLAPCLVSHHEDLRPPGGQDAQRVRSTSATQTKLRAPAPRTFPATCHGFHRVGASRSLGSGRLDRGTERFHGARFASADRRGHNIRKLRVVLTLASCFAGCWPAAATSVGVFFPRRPRSTEPLTSLSPLPFPPAREPDLRQLAFSFACVRKPPRPP
jgi:hypothetical protein